MTNTLSMFCFSSLVAGLAPTDASVVTAALLDGPGGIEFVGENVEQPVDPEEPAPVTQRSPQRFES